jgi:hypothetical protein
MSRIAATILTTMGIATFWPYVAVALLATAYAVHVFTLKLEIREVCHVLEEATAALTQAKEDLWQAQDHIETLEGRHGRGAVNIRG